MKLITSVKGFVLSLGLISSLVFSQAIIKGEVSPGVYKPIQVQRDGYISPQEYYAAVGFGDILNVRRIAALGNNPVVDVATVPEDVWSEGGLYPWMTAATSLELVSDNAADTAAGTGARSVVINCLTDLYVEQSDVVVTNGTTPVALPRQCFRVNNSLIMSAGSGKVNAGKIVIRDAGGGTIRAAIPAGVGITKQSNYTVPAGYTLQILSNYLGVAGTGTSKTADASTYIQSSLGFYRMPFTLSAGDGVPYRHDGVPGLIVPEKTDYMLRITSVSANGTSVNGAWLGILRKNVP